MKNLKTILLGLSLFVVVGAANAKGLPPKFLTKNYVINTYIDAMTRGKLNGMDDVVDQNAKFSLLRGKQVLSFDKKQIMDNMKLNKDVEMDCTTNTSIVESNADITVVKVDMKFPYFVRCNYVTMVNTGAGWKITNVYSTFN